MLNNFFFFRIKAYWIVFDRIRTDYYTLFIFLHHHFECSNDSSFHIIMYSLVQQLLYYIQWPVYSWTNLLPTNITPTKTKSSSLNKDLMLFHVPKYCTMLSLIPTY